MDKWWNYMFDKVFSLYPAYNKVYGSYTRTQDGRKFVILYNTETGDRTTRLLAKIVLEIKLGRLLLENETVDHIDGNPFNDDPSNLQILSREGNASKSAVHRVVREIECPWCSSLFIPSKDQLKTRNKNRSGPFCSRSCSGKFNAAVRAGLIKVAPRIIPDSEYK